ncbi:MAG: YkgJ family cysteine cluster protein [Nannocystaceae bacterium]
MVWGLLASLFGRNRLPRDRPTRISGAAKKAGAPHVAAMQEAIDRLAALEGLADIANTKRIPKGFHEAIRDLQRAHDQYIAAVAEVMGLSAAIRPGTPEGQACCREAPLGVTAAEGIVLYRTLRTWPDFPDVAKRLAEAGELLFEDIKAHHKGKDLEKVRMGGKAVLEGRKAFAARGLPCPLLDGKGRCRAWDVRPQSCRMHHVRSGPETLDPASEAHAKIDVVNLRIPVRQQVALMQVEKRMLLQASPFLHANIMQLAQITQGDQLYEVGEAPLRFGPDGAALGRANRNKPGAKKYKGKGKGGKAKGKGRR